MKRNRNAVTGLLLVVFCFVSSNINAQSVTIDMGIEHQIIRGFGGMNHPEWRPDLTEDLIDMCYGNAPDQLGMTIFRTHVPEDTANFNRVFPSALKAYRDHDALVFASPWNPPQALWDSIGDRRALNHDMYGEYRDHLNSFIEFMDQGGAPLYAISVQNEPDIKEWTSWTPNEMVNFLQNYAQDLNTMVMAPESFQFRDDMMNAVLNDSLATAHTDIVVGHIYGGGLKEHTLAHQKGKEVWMTEHLLGSHLDEVNDWNLALTVGKEINDCMQANFSAYLWWYIQRFYGLISEDGNILDKGYVMSQFTKFVRPGALRVGETVASANGISATAYKTDSSFVVVIINESSSNIELDFTIENGTVDSLVQFTTSATKKMVNDGGISITGGSFTATVDAKSVTTFTSYFANGPAYGNKPPMADIGDDIALLDEEGDGEIINLNSDLCHDSDGEIVRYNWVLNDKSVSTDPSYDLNAEIGDHVLILTVTDNDGATDSDTLNISITTTYTTEIWMDVECGQYGSNWQFFEDENASYGGYISVIPDTQSLSAPSPDTANQLILNFYVPEAGPYKVWGRVIAPSADDDSFWVTMDDDSVSAMWNNIPTGDDWHWDDVHTNSNNDDVMVYVLDTGYHKLTIVFREDGALLDKIFIANTGTVPEGIGLEDANCPEDPDPEPESVSDKTENSAIRVYPNPATDEIHVSWEEGFTSITILGMDGKVYLQNEYGIKQQNADISINMEPGIVVLMFRNDNHFEVRKLIIE